MDKRRNAVFPILHILRMQKRKHRMKETAALKYRERNEEKTPSGCPEHGTKFIQAKIRAIVIYTRLVCGWGEIYTSQYKYEACIKRKNYMEGLYKKKELWERVV